LRIPHTESSIGWGGQELRILTEAQGMLARGHQVTLLTPESADIYPAARARNIPVVALPMEKKRPQALLAARRWLAGQRGRFDVINTHSSTDSWLVALARATLGDMPPIVRTRHVSTRVHKDRATRWLYQTASAHIVTAGEALRAQLARENGFALERMTSVPTGIDLARFRPMDRIAARREAGLHERLALGIVATLRDWKGHDYLLEAWRALQATTPGWQLLIIGDGPRRAHLERRVQELGLSASLRFTGNQDDVPAWLACLDIAVLPSYGDEGVPQSLMQAAACGLPSVSTPVGAIAEAVVHGDTGLLVPPRDPHALAQALETLMRDPALRERMGRAAHAYAQAHFGIDLMLDAMEAVFSRVAARARNL